MRVIRAIVNTLATLIVLVVLALVLFPPVRTLAQTAGMVLGGVSGLTRTWPIPAYLKSVNITTHTTTTIKNTPGVVGCVAINTIGGMSDKVILYNSMNATAALATIDTTTQNELCYGMIFNGVLQAVTSGSGTAADITITYR